MDGQLTETECGLKGYTELHSTPARWLFVA